MAHWHFPLKPASLLNQKVIVDFQDFGLATEARPQTAGRAVAQFKTACSVGGLGGRVV